MTTVFVTGLGLSAIPLTWDGSAWSAVVPIVHRSCPQ
jgi:hypothetical protein